MKTTKKVFLIEDDQDDQWFFKDALSKINKVCFWGLAQNGNEALKQLKEADLLPDIIFSDVNMPIMGGVECYMNILKNPETKNIPVVFLTNDMSNIEKVLQLGACAFINKPSDEKTLRLKIQQVIRQEFYINPFATNNYLQSSFKGLGLAQNVQIPKPLNVNI
ncbi:response regulator [Arcicella rosea]|uniref:CheY-like chemotaxis protein n=1 Tax=Arcicella rosea TaxID=502909 RepID=A0A841EME8_9BACT|nr:response regulator [Arcicella rosea]MBB6004385.1 CheY-like chemotaxis protein [Arcicella rosea]